LLLNTASERSNLYIATNHFLCNCLKETTLDFTDHFDRRRTHSV